MHGKEGRTNRELAAYPSGTASPPGSDQAVTKTAWPLGPQISIRQLNRRLCMLETIPVLSYKDNKLYIGDIENRYFGHGKTRVRNFGGGKSPCGLGRPRPGLAKLRVSLERHSC